MELRRVLFEYRLTQSAVARAAVASGYKLNAGVVCKTANGKHRAHPLEREAMRAGLMSLGVPKGVVEAIPEIVPRERWR